jgi:hypothetical protein
LKINENHGWLYPQNADLPEDRSDRIIHGSHGNISGYNENNEI